MVAEERAEKITVRERDGKTLQTIQNEKMRNPSGVATGPNGVTMSLMRKLIACSSSIKMVDSSKLSRMSSCSPISSSPLTIDCTCLTLIKM